MSSLNHGLTVGYQVTESLRLHLGCSKSEARERAIMLFRKVGLPGRRNCCTNIRISCRVACGSVS